MDFVYLVPSWNIFPTSIPREMVTELSPHSGHIPPSMILAKSRYSASPTSREISSPVKSAVLGNYRRVDSTAEVVGELGFVNVQIAADKQHDIAVVGVALEYHRLAGLFGSGFEQPADFLDSVAVGSAHFG